MVQHFDLAILGGGCAGLSLAWRLSKDPHWLQTTVIIEPRINYTNDRSWCFWEATDQGLQQELIPLISYHWYRWRFSGSKFDCLHHADGRAYCYIAADHFYKETLSAINNHSYTQLWQGTAATSVCPSPAQGFSITLNNGKTVSARQIIDTRPPCYRDSSQATLWQIFYGLEIQTDTPIFDFSTVGLMEDLSSSSDATQFLYTLPFTAKHALVELTLFTPILCKPDSLSQPLQNYLIKKFGIHDYKVLRKEYGCLPMGLRSVMHSKTADYQYAGTIAGATRPATGYAFMRIQNWARQCAKVLIEANDNLYSHPSPKILRIMDDIFLRVLHDAPDLGASFFQSLAQHVPASALVRFLSDEALATDYWHMIRALPAWRFIMYSLRLNKLFYRCAYGR